MFSELECRRRRYMLNLHPNARLETVSKRKLDQRLFDREYKNDPVYSDKGIVRAIRLSPSSPSPLIRVEMLQCLVVLLIGVIRYALGGINSGRLSYVVRGEIDLEMAVGKGRREERSESGLMSIKVVIIWSPSFTWLQDRTEDLIVLVLCPRAKNERCYELQGRDRSNSQLYLPIKG